MHRGCETRFTKEVKFWKFDGGLDCYHVKAEIINLYFDVCYVRLHYTKELMTRNFY